MTVATGLGIVSPLVAAGVANYWNSQEFNKPLGNIRLTASSLGKGCPYGNNNHSYAEATSIRSTNYGIEAIIASPITSIKSWNKLQDTEEMWEKFSSPNRWIENGFLVGKWSFFDSSPWPYSHSTKSSQEYYGLFWANMDSHGFFRHRISYAAGLHPRYRLQIDPNSSSGTWLVKDEWLSGSHNSKSGIITSTLTHSNPHTMVAKDASFGLELMCNSNLFYGTAQHSTRGLNTSSGRWLAMDVGKKILGKLSSHNNYSYGKFSHLGPSMTEGSPPRSIHYNYAITSNGQAMGRKIYVKEWH